MAKLVTQGTQVDVVQDQVQSLLTITDSDCRTGYEESQELRYNDCKLKTDLELVDVIKSFLTEIAEEGNLTERVLKYNTGFIIGILSLK